jgi:hypothetical protein
MVQPKTGIGSTVPRPEDRAGAHVQSRAGQVFGAE